MRTRIEPEAGPGPGGDSRLTPGPAAGEGTRGSRSCGCRVLGVVATGGSRVHWAPERAPVGLGRARSEATSEGPEGAPATEGEGAPATEACRLCRPSSPERSEGGRSPVRRTDDATPPYALFHPQAVCRRLQPETTASGACFQAESGSARSPGRCTFSASHPGFSDEAVSIFAWYSRVSASTRSRPR